jgi:hypothetical protein
MCKKSHNPLTDKILNLGQDDPDVKNYNVPACILQ